MDINPRCCASFRSFLSEQSAHLVQAADFLRRVDDLPAAGALRVHPPNLFRACYAAIQLMLSPTESSGRSGREAFQPAATLQSQMKRLKTCVRDSGSLVGRKDRRRGARTDCNIDDKLAGGSSEEPEVTTRKQEVVFLSFTEINRRNPK